MAKYTQRGSTALDQCIDGHLRRIAEVAQPHALAGILLGGYGRGEGSPFINPDGTQSPFNDYDLIVVVDKKSKELRRKLNAQETQLTEELGLPVDLCPYISSHLRRCEFSLLNYEMKYGHKVVWGDENILSAMPDYPHSAIPFSEGSRLLLNRGKLLLDIQQRLAEATPLTEEERIRFIKFIHKALLALGDCALLSSSQYDISYHVKKERIQHIGNCPARTSVINGFLNAVELKEWGDFQALENYDIAREFNRVREIFLRFMSWYRAQHAQRECSIPKAIALNLKWNRTLDTNHPRERLYDAILGLLGNNPICSAEKFYQLQRRFS
ncbi:hypothetical protein SCARR_03373 [Pontiella sulfatireligans]|uniref:Polymerase nucleotidyl transferase domain-containing protein n=2 Tax=Pontiella sulfatireligans TaxID=2750658 RepID=A0A6C2UPV0_9BACT|nr:hypothetical protein SCARR_03373 [Pontiella sulfatireligans]